jgi:hypothetical protein
MRCGVAAVIGAGAGLLAAVIGNGSWALAQQHGNQGRVAENWQPVDQMHLYLCAFHVAKENPAFQVQANHYCSAPGKDLHQCVIYDSRESNAKLLGVEYIIPDSVYQALLQDERKYWHPHAYEIIAGQLVAPDLADLGDEAFKGFITSWGKTWHTWRDPSSALPLGAPLLMWSANGDGQIDQKLIEARDADLGISTAEIRRRRQAYGYAVPGVPPPKSIGEAGRRWSPTGPDEPRKVGQPQ